MSAALVEGADASAAPEGCLVERCSGNACAHVCTLVQAFDVVTAAVAVGLVAGLVEGAYWGVKQHWLGELTCLHPGYGWMSPLFLVAILSPLAVGLAIAALMRPHWNLVPFSVTIFALLGWLNATAVVKKGEPFDGNTYLLDFTKRLRDRLGGLEIAHLKMTLDPGDPSGSLSVGAAACQVLQ